MEGEERIEKGFLYFFYEIVLKILMSLVYFSNLFSFFFVNNYFPFSFAKRLKKPANPIFSSSPDSNNSSLTHYTVKPFFDLSILPKKRSHHPQSCL